MRQRSFVLVHSFLLFATMPGLCAAAELPPVLVRVLDGDGRPLAGAAVHAAAEPEDPDRPAAILREETGPDGTARLSGLPGDRIVWVLAERRGFSPALRSFSGASEARRELRIVLELDGRWSIEGLSPGTWPIRAHLGRGIDPPSFSKTIEIPPGVTEMHLELRFADGDGVPD